MTEISRFAARFQRRARLKNWHIYSGASIACGTYWLHWRTLRWYRSTCIEEFAIGYSCLLLGSAFCLERNRTICAKRDTKQRMIHNNFSLRFIPCDGWISKRHNSPTRFSSSNQRFFGSQSRTLQILSKQIFLEDMNTTQKNSSLLQYVFFLVGSH